MIGETFKLMLCISYWEARKIRGPMAVFFVWHNLGCSMKANKYRRKLMTYKYHAKGR